MAFALEAPMPNKSRRSVSALAALRLTFVDCSVLAAWTRVGAATPGLATGAAVVATERLVRKAKMREEMNVFCIGDAP